MFNSQLLEPYKLIFGNMLDSFSAKLAFIFGAILSFFAPIMSIVWSIVFLIIIDFITGIWASVKKDGWSSIKARRMVHSISKIILYNVAIITSHVVTEHLAPMIPFVNLSCYLIALIEMKSVFENINTVIKVNLWKAIREFLNNKMVRKNGDA